MFPHAMPRSLNGALLLASTMLCLPAWAAGECKVEYGYHTGTGASRQDHTTVITFDAQQSRDVNRSNLNYVRNVGSNKVDVTLSGALSNNFRLDVNQRNPSGGYYLTATTLLKLACTNQLGTTAAGTPAQLAAALKQAGKTAEQIAAQLRTTFNLTGQQVAAVLKAANYTASQIAAALVSAFNATGAQVASWLKAVGYTGEQVAAALKAQFNATASQVASWLKSAFSATGEQVAAWLKAAGYTGEQVAAALKAQFNATASQVASWLKSAFNATGSQVAAWLQTAAYGAEQVAAALKAQFNATGQQVAAWLKAAGYTGEQVAAALKAAFNATAQQAATWLKSAFNAGAQQLAQWLRGAGYTLLQVAQALDQLNFDPAQIAAVVKQVFGVSWTELVRSLEIAFDVFRRDNCGAAGCNQPAQLLRQAGARVEEALRALREVYGLSEAMARSLARSVWGLTGAAMDAAMAAAGYAVTQATRVAAGAMELNYVVLGNSFRSCNQYPNGTIYGMGGGLAPLPLPRTGAAHVVTLLGNSALATASAVTGWPAGTRVSIRERGTCYLVLEIVVPAAAIEGATGRATVMAGREAGPSLAWQVGPVRSSGAHAPAPVVARPGAGSTNTGSGSVRATLSAAGLYKVGSGTTQDADANNYSQLDPFNRSPHCQTVPEPSPTTNTSGQLMASRLTIQVPPIAWNVRNTGSTAAQNVVVELVRGGQVLDQRTVTNLAPGQQMNFSFSRPNNAACVAKVGAGGGCYHCGLPTEGWNDNGVAVRVR